MYTNGYGTGGYPSYAQYDYMHEQKMQQKREIKRIGLFTGLTLIAFLVLQNMIVVFMILTGLYDKYTTDPVFQTACDIIMTVIIMLLPFTVLGNKLKKINNTIDCFPLGRSNDKLLAVLAIPSGLGICMAANIVTSYVTNIISLFGVKLSSPDIANPGGIAGFALSVIRVSVIAGIIEEISFRGSVMQPLRKYGDTFAVTMAAFAFGIMHCNLIQAPFALIVGFGLGYICVKTGSLWPGIIVHALNNFVSTAVSYMLSNGVNESKATVIYGLVVYSILAVGAVSFVFMVRRAKRVCPPPIRNGLLSTGEKTAAYLLNPATIISLIAMLFYTSQYISLGK